MGWIIVLLGLGAFIALEVRRHRRRRAVRIAVPVGVRAAPPASYKPAIIATYLVFPLACWAVYRDMALDRPLWLPGLDTWLAIVGSLWLSCKLAPAHGNGAGGVFWALSVAGWIMVMSGIAIAGEGPEALADFDLIASSILEWVQEILA